MNDFKKKQMNNLKVNKLIYLNTCKVRIGYINWYVFYYLSIGVIIGQILQVPFRNPLKICRMHLVAFIPTKKSWG